MKLWIGILFYWMAVVPAIAQKEDPFLLNLLSKHPAEFGEIVAHPEMYRVQIVYTQIIRDNKNIPHFKEYTYRLNPAEYFYPASTVKLPLAVIALDKINSLHIQGLTKSTMAIYDSAGSRQETIYNNPYAVDGRQTIEEAIREIFLVSDNNAANRLFEFIGQERIHQTLEDKGYKNAYVRNRLDLSRTGEENRQTQAVTFVDNNGKIIYQQPAQYNQQPLPYYNAVIGNGYYNNNDSLIQSPMNFSEKNRIYLSDLQHILRSVLFFDQTPQRERFNLTKDDRQFLIKWMHTLPTESQYPTYDSSYYYGNITKFLLAGSSKTPLPPSIKIFNKAGDAYGFLIDNAYIIDTDKKIEFLLSAVIYCNKDGILNDDHYDYETVGLPFMKNLGQLIYDYELTRKKAVLPNFDDLLQK